MLAVEREVEEVVDDVDRRGRRAERDEGEQAGGEHADVEIFVRQHHRHGDQHVLGPLMGAQHFQVGLEGRLRRLEQLGAVLGLPARGMAVGRNDDRLARHVEAGEVVAAVAGIVEAAVAIGLDQRGALLLRGEIVMAVGRVHGVEHAEMRGDRLGEFARRAGGKDDAAAGCTILAQPLDQRLAIGKRRPDRCRCARQSPASAAPGPTAARPAP